ncbi:MAG: hypothetical protein WCE20_15800 [Rhizomicrobium sp.]
MSPASIDALAVALLRLRLERPDILEYDLHHPLAPACLAELVYLLDHLPRIAILEIVFAHDRIELAFDLRSIVSGICISSL